MHRTVLPAMAVAIATLAAGCEHSPVAPPAQGPVLLATGTGYSSWSPAIRLEETGAAADPAFNTPSLDGCPFTSRDGRTLYMASNREGGLGGIDIWVSRRTREGDPWGPPVNIGVPVNSSADDFCPTIDRDGHRFFFVSRRVVEGGCGGADIYETRLGDDGGFEEPRNLGCAVNSAADEASPFPLPERATGPVLYFSSTRPGLGTGGDLYRSESRGGVFGPAEPVPGINSAADDGQPNLRRDGLEIFFYSTRTDGGAQGGPDIWSARRPSVSSPWSAPVNLGTAVNSSSGETRPSLSWDGTTLYFGSARPASENGSNDIYVTTRERLTAGEE